MEPEDRARRAAALIEAQRCLEDVERRLVALHRRPRPWHSMLTMVSGAVTAGAGAYLTATLVALRTPQGPSRLGILGGLVTLVTGTALTMAGLAQVDAAAREKRLLRALRHLLTRERA